MIPSQNNLDDKLKNKILKIITPTKEEVNSLKMLVDIFQKKLYTSAKSKGYEINVELGGSYAKNTYLRGDFDIDFFIQFDTNIKDEIKEKMLIDILETSNIEFNMKHGSRLYVSGFFNNFSSKHLINDDLDSKNLNNRDFGFNFECVPTEICNDVTKAKNSTDISIFHVKYLQKKIQDTPKLIDEIRIAKKWFKAQNLYGAESYINGFSGHSIECLIMKFKTFDNLMLFFSQMNKGEILIVDEKYSDNILFSKDKLSPLMIQDPILMGRNALSALSDEVFYRAKFMAINSLQQGFRENDFLSSDTNNDLHKLKKDFFKEELDFLAVIYTIKKNDFSKDIIGSKLLKLTKKISKLLIKNGFNVLSVHFKISEENSTAFAKIVIENSIVSKKYLTKSIGLDVSKEYILNFLNNHQDSKLRLINNFIYIEKKRDFSTIEDFIDLHLNQLVIEEQKIIFKQHDIVDNISLMSKNQLTYD